MTVTSATIKQIAGLYSSPNPYGEIPEGALTIADEVVVRARGVLEPRRGMPPSVNSFAADRCFPLPNTRNAVTTARLASNPSVYSPDADTVTPISRSGGLQPFGYPYQSDARTSVWGAVANSNLYLNGQQGTVAVAGSATPSWRQAGLPRPPGFCLITIDTTGANAPNNFILNQRRTFMLTLAWYDPLGNFYESEPSEPFYIENTSSYNGGGTAAGAPKITFLTYPPMTPAGAFYRLWRAAETAAGATSGAEFFLTREYVDPAQTTGADGYVNNTIVAGIYDTSTDSLLNVPLYTNPLTGFGFGISGQNTRPPAASSIAWFKQRMYFGRTTFQQEIVLQIIGTGPGGVNIGDTINVGGVNLTAIQGPGTGGGSGLPPGLGFPQFYVRTDLLPNQNIEYTARSLTASINFQFENGIAASSAPNRKLYAYYASNGINDFGRIIILRSVPSPLTDDPGIQFSVVTTSPGIRFPNGSIMSTDSYAPGGISWSNVNEPESVPGINFDNVGDPDKAVLGFAVLRDAMLIFKEDGVWILYDTGAPLLTIQVLDPTVICIAPQSIAVLNNAAYCLTARGVVQITEQSTQQVSEPIRTTLQDLIFQNKTLEAIAFGAGYEAERLYVLGMPIGPTENSCSQQFVLNIQTSAWTRWLKAGATSAMQLANQQKLLMTYASPLPTGNVVVGVQPQGVYYERKGNVCSMDFADVIGSLPAATYAAVTGLAIPQPGAPPIVQGMSTLTFAQDMHQQVFEGDLFWFTYTDTNDSKKRSQYARVVSVAKAVVTMDSIGVISTDGTNLMTKAPVYYRGIQSHWRYAQVALGEPTMEKQWRQSQHAFRYFDGDWFDVALDTEKTTTTPSGYVQVAPDAKAALPGNTPLGSTIWGRNARDVILRADPAAAESRGARFGMEFVFGQALAHFQLVAGAALADGLAAKATR